jgi:hypothetical protein
MKLHFIHIASHTVSGATLSMIWAQKLISSPQSQADFQDQGTDSRRDADPEQNRTLTATDLSTIAEAQNPRSKAYNNAERR